MNKKRFKLVPSSYLVLINNGKILLSRRFNTGFQDGKYSLVAGHLNGNESFTQTVIREAEEEANIDIKPDNLKVAHVMNRNEKLNKAGLRERIDIFFSAKKWKGKIKNTEPNKCDDLSWFPLNKLPKNTIPYIKYAIDNIKKKIFYSEFDF